MDNYGTHQRLLTRAALNTNGSILELGCGWYSTPILHEIAKAQNRYLLTHDNSPKWYVDFRSIYASASHHFGLLNRPEWRQPWGLVFVDHGPLPDLPRNDKGLLNALDRGQAILDLMNYTGVFVLHDTQPEVCWEYDWDKVFPLFKYRVDDITQGVGTTILSNRIDVRKWS